MSQPQTDRPDYHSRAYQQMERAHQVISDVSRGTLHLRDCAREYLPKFPAEAEDAYRDRVRQAVFFNAYNRTVNGLVGMVFKKNPILSADVPPEMVKHAENIDLAGAHFDVFSKEVLQDAFAGHSFILVDMQRALSPRATLQDELRAGRRPYWVRYTAEQAINFRPVVIDGQTHLGQITFAEELCEAAGHYGEAEVQQYRTFRLEQLTDERGLRCRQVVWELNRKTKDERGEESFALIDGGTLSLSRIPVAVVYGKKTGFLTSQPPLLDLALTNLNYWQKRSDYSNTLHTAGVPLLVGVGIPEEWNMLVAGAGYMLRVPAAGGDVKYVEPTGASLEAARLDLQDVRSEMAALGLSVLAARPAQAQATATETLIDFTQESSELMTIARSLTDALELCLSFHAEYLGLKTGGGSVSLGAELKSLTLAPAQVATYSKMVAERQISLSTLWAILKRGDALPDDFDEQVELERLYGKGADAKSVIELDAGRMADERGGTQDDDPPLPAGDADAETGGAG